MSETGVTWAWTCKDLGSNCARLRTADELFSDPTFTPCFDIDPCPKDWVDPFTPRCPYCKDFMRHIDNEDHASNEHFYCDRCNYYAAPCQLGPFVPCPICGKPEAWDDDLDHYSGYNDDTTSLKEEWH